MQITKLKTVSALASVSCDRCGITAEVGDLLFPEFLSVDITGGYASPFGDGTTVQVDLCPCCLKETLGPWLRVLVSEPRPMALNGIGFRSPLGSAESAGIPGFQKVVDAVQQMVNESGEPKNFDAAGWVAKWMQRPVPALGGKRPAEFMLTAEGHETVLSLLAQAVNGTYA